MRSFRARLTLWNVLVLAIVLSAFAFALVLSNQARAAQAIDRELEGRAREVLGPPGGRRQQNNGDPSPPRDGTGPGRDDGPGQGEGRRPGGPPSVEQMRRMGIDENTIRMAQLRRPRVFDAQGQPDGPMRNDTPLDSRGLDLALKGQHIYASVPWQGRRIRVLSWPILQNGRVDRVAQVARDLEPLDELWQAQIATVSIAVPVALLIAAAGAFFLTARAMRPIGAMKAAAASITEADLSKRLNIQGQDEFADLGKTFNSMIARLEVAFSQLHTAYHDLSEASEQQRRFTADASHELRTPLTRLRLAIDVANAPGATQADKDRAVAVADSTTRSMSNLVQELLLLARADAGQMHLKRERLDLRLVASDAVSALPHDKQDRITTEFPSEAVAMVGDADSLQRLATNLLANALRHTEEGKSITIRVRSLGDEVELSVEDHGEGIAPEHLPKIKERFYRVDSARSAGDGGAGLGLAICDTITQAHGGRLCIASDSGKGTRVAAYFPKNPENK